MKNLAYLAVVGVGLGISSGAWGALGPRATNPTVTLQTAAGSSATSQPVRLADGKMTPTPAPRPIVTPVPAPTPIPPGSPRE